MERTYSDAVSALNTLQSNFSVIDAIRKSGQMINENSMPEMIEWCRRIGYERSDFDRFKPIHIAGTKGKGSTSAIVSYILSQYNPPLRKIGLYTSPHLRFVRERIQINNQPLSEPLFTKYFFQVWDRLEDAARSKSLPTDSTCKPVYFRFLTLVAFHAYLSEGVQTAIIECGIGGEYDCTNIILTPTVTAITTLGIDHTNMLGKTIDKIAWHKTGIMKPSVPCYTAPQPPPAIEVLHSRAQEKSSPLHLVDRHPALETITLGLAGDFQKTNASLAIQLAASHLRTLGHDISTTPSLPPEFITGLRSVRWPGRCDTRTDSINKNLTWHLDGAHTLESMELVGKWFSDRVLASASASASPPPPPRILLFNQQRRDASALARTLHSSVSLSPFTHAVFCSNLTYLSAGYKPDLVSINASSDEVRQLSVQRELAETWARLESESEKRGGTEAGDGGKRCEIKVVGTIEEAVRWVRNVAGESTTATAAAADVDARGKEHQQPPPVMVLATGSVHLVGGVLEVLESETPSGAGQ